MDTPVDSEFGGARKMVSRVQHGVGGENPAGRTWALYSAPKWARTGATSALTSLDRPPSGKARYIPNAAIGASTENRCPGYCRKDVGFGPNSQMRNSRLPSSKILWSAATEGAQAE